MIRKKALLTLHFLFACSYLMWLFSKPFLHEVFTQKEESYLFSAVIEKKEFFELLPHPTQEKIYFGEEQRHQEREGSYFASLKKILLEQTSPFGIAWLFFSFFFLFSLTLPLKMAPRGAYLLPVLVLGYFLSLGNYAQALPEEETLFPLNSAAHSEVAYSKGFKERKKTMLRGWHHYIVKNYLQEEPSVEETQFQRQVERGLFAFDVARLESLLEKKGRDDVAEALFTPPSFFSCLLFLLWNTFFAVTINKSYGHSRSKQY